MRREAYNIPESPDKGNEDKWSLNEVGQWNPLSTACTLPFYCGLLSLKHMLLSGPGERQSMLEQKGTQTQQHEAKAGR